MHEQTDGGTEGGGNKSHLTESPVLFQLVEPGDGNRWYIHVTLNSTTKTLGVFSASSDLRVYTLNP